MGRCCHEFLGVTAGGGEGSACRNVAAFADLDRRRSICQPALPCRAPQPHQRVDVAFLWHCAGLTCCNVFVRVLTEPNLSAKQHGVQSDSPGGPNPSYGGPDENAIERAASQSFERGGTRCLWC